MAASLRMSCALSTSLKNSRPFSTIFAPRLRLNVTSINLRPLNNLLLVNNSQHSSAIYLRHQFSTSPHLYQQDKHKSGQKEKESEKKGHSAHSTYNIFGGPDTSTFSLWGGFVGAFILGTIIYNFQDQLARLIFGKDFAIERVQYEFPTKDKPHPDQSTNSSTMQEQQKKKPSKIEGLPEKVPYLLVGGGTASHSAMRAIRGHDAKAKVLIISDEPYTPYMRPALSKELWFSEPELVKDFKFKWWNGRERSIFYEIDELYIPVNELADRETGGVSVAKNVRVLKLDPDQRIAYLNNGQSIRYEKCLLAPGGHPKNLPVFKNAPREVQDRTILFRTADDFKRLEMVSRKAKRVVIVGGGFLGSELACALGRRSIIDNKSIKSPQNQHEVIQIFPEQGVLGKVLPEYLSKWTTERVKSEGVTVMSNTQVEDAKFNGKNIDLKLSDGQTIQTDYVVVAVGLEPDTELARSSGLEVDEKTGGYLVNSELEARSNIWVAGDSSCFYDMKLGRRRVEHHDHAIVSGRLAGQNMVGAGKPYTHQSMFWSDLGPEIAFEAIGIVDSSLPTVAVFAKAQSEDMKEKSNENKQENEKNETKKEETKEDKREEKESSDNDELHRLRLPEPDDDYQRGVIFYLKDDVIVGIVLWNLFNRLSVARRLLREDKRYDDFSEVAKLFNVHSAE